MLRIQTQQLLSSQRACMAQYITSATQASPTGPSENPVVGHRQNRQTAMLPPTGPRGWRAGPLLYGRGENHTVLPEKWLQQSAIASSPAP